jgi:hypothetical protein
VAELDAKTTENCKVILRRALELLERDKGHVTSYRYDEVSAHEGELAEYEYRFDVEMVTSERFALRLPVTMRTKPRKPLATIEVSVHGVGDYGYSYSEHNAASEPVKSAVRYALDDIARSFGEESGTSEEER